MHLTTDPDALAARIATPDWPLVLDLRTPEDFAHAPHLLPGCLRMAHVDAHPAHLDGVLAPGWRGREILTVCHRGLKISQGAAARLDAEGLCAGILAGGMVAWRAAGLPVTVRGALPRSGLWVAGTADPARTAVAHWLITRGAPPGTRLLCVAEASRADVATRFDARPVGDLEALAGALGLGLAQISVLIGAAIAPPQTVGSLAGLLAVAAARPDLGRPDSPALPLLDLAWAHARSTSAR